MSIHSFRDAAEYLGTKEDRPVANNTRLQRRGSDRIAVVLHGSDVVTYTPDHVTLDSCGYLTHTTKERLNSFGARGTYVYQNRGQWYLRETGTECQWVFADGITIDSDGNVTGAGEESSVIEKQRTARRIGKYVKAYMSALIAGKVEKPGPGDCVYCQMREVESGRPLGEVARGNGHIEHHLDESYFVPSLLYRAIEVYPVSIAARGRLGELWGFNPTKSEFLDGILVEQAGSSLRRYLRAQLGIA